jgi:predicted TIM-barrel fold metal-dependent hydrolase
MFGSDYPAVSPVQAVEDFDRLGFDEAARKAILHDNLLRFLGEEIL